MDSFSWLASLKVGDEVVYRDTCKAFHVLKVLRLTKTLIVCNNMRFRKDDGYMVPFDSWHMLRIEPITDELKEKLFWYKLVNRLSAFKWENVPLEKLVAVDRALKAIN